MWSKSIISRWSRKISASCFAVCNQCASLFILDYTVQSQRMQLHPYEHMYANPISVRIFENWSGKFSRLKKSLQTSHYRQERHLPLKTQHNLGSEVLPRLSWPLDLIFDIEHLKLVLRKFETLHIFHRLNFYIQLAKHHLNKSFLGLNN